jgi:hypothetical protein
VAQRDKWIATAKAREELGIALARETIDLENTLDELRAERDEAVALLRKWREAVYRGLLDLPTTATVDWLAAYAARHPAPEA